jgi:hypothetical protein
MSVPTGSIHRGREKVKAKVHSHHGLGDGAGVGADHSDLESLGDAPDPVRILGEEVTRETNLSVVGESLSRCQKEVSLLPDDFSSDEMTYDDLLLGLEPNQSSQGPESLLAVEELHSSIQDTQLRNNLQTHTVGRDLGENRRVIHRPLSPLAADKDLGPLRDGVVDVLRP